MPLAEPVNGAAPPILSADDLTLKRGRRRIHENLTISFPAGITAILGPNGAGKTTLIEGLLRPTRVGAGTVSLDGSLVPTELTEADFLAQVGHMPQSWTFFGSFSVLESVEYVAWLKRIPSGRIRAAANDALRATDMLEHCGTKIGKLSGGMRQRVGLAEAFVTDPRVVLLDEPTVGLDPAQRASFRRHVAAHAADRAIVLSTHLTEDVAALADRVIVVARGKIQFDGTPTDLANVGATDSDSPSIEAGYLAIVDPDARSAPR